MNGRISWEPEPPHDDHMVQNFAFMASAIDRTCPAQGPFLNMAQLWLIRRLSVIFSFVECRTAFWLCAPAFSNFHEIGGIIERKCSQRSELSDYEGISGLGISNEH